MFVSRYIVKFLKEKGIQHVFGVTGTTVNMCFVALGETEGIDYICPLHEQTASMGADGYSRVSGKIGVAIGTSGPGTTNMVTGCAGAFFDSIPILYIVGQTSVGNSKQSINIRHFGFQELDSEKVFNSITKYVHTVYDPLKTKYELEKAISIALSDRKGPTMLVFPENVLYSDIDENELESFREEGCKKNSFYDYSKIIRLIEASSKPLLLLGGGIHIGKAESLARDFVEKTSIPFALTYPARDLLETNNDLNVGSIGIFGSQYGNMAIQNADLLVCVGARMDKYVTGNNPGDFSPNSKKIIIDIDEQELNKMKSLSFLPEIAILEDANVFFKEMLKYDYSTLEGKFKEWKDFIASNKLKYPLCQESFYLENTINPYVFIKLLSEIMEEGDYLFTDTGLSAVWVGQSFEFKKRQRWFTQFSYSSMGYGLSATIGGSFATENRVICVTGDGGIQMTIQDLSTIKFYNKNIKVFIVCNDGYGLIQKTQDDFNNGHHATDRDNHVPLPDLKKIVEAYDLKCFEIRTNNQLISVIKRTLKSDGPAICLVHIPISKKISPRIRGGKKLDEMYPYF